MSRDISKFVDPERWRLVEADAAALGLVIKISCVDRTADEQAAYWAQGREPLFYVNRLRKIAGLPPIARDENKRKITWVSHSKHEPYADGLSRAIDFYISNHGEPAWSIKADVNHDQLPDYKQVAEIARKHGFRPGIDFGDPCHLEIISEA